MKLNQKILKELILEELEDYMAENNPDLQEAFPSVADIKAGFKDKNVFKTKATGEREAMKLQGPEVEAQQKVLELQKILDMPGTAVDRTMLRLLDRVLKMARQRAGALPGLDPEQHAPAKSGGLGQTRRDYGGATPRIGGLEERDTKQPKQPQKGKKTRGK